jgi:hypothetical protein
MTRSWVILAQVAAVLAVSACGGGGTSTGCDDGSDFGSRLVVHDHEGNTDDFIRDRPLELEYSFTNCRDRTIHLLYSSTPGAGFSIDRWPIQEGSSVWSGGFSMYDYGTQDAVAPGEKLTRSDLWVDAPAAEPGDYVARGWLTDCSTEPRSGFECPEPASVRFTIEGNE